MSRAVVKKPKPKKKPEPKGAPLGFRVPSDIKDALEQAAEADGRSVSSLCLRVLTQWLKENGFLK
jgi:uncharacterized protein (DUF1778 family)